MNPIVGGTISIVITTAICAFFWIAGGRAMKRREEQNRKNSHKD